MQSPEQKKEKKGRGNSRERQFRQGLCVLWALAGGNMCMFVCVSVFIVCHWRNVQWYTRQKGGKATAEISWPSFYVCVYKVSDISGK